MKIFKINENFEVVCEWKKTRTAFKHVATLLKNGEEVDNTKICYLNRTWECYEFESVLEKLLDRTDLLTKEEKKNFLERNKRKDKEEVDSQFNMVAGIAKLGEIFGETKKEKNDWKTRMLKAGLENKGLIMPEDWDTLSEEEKEKRLNNVIKELG